MAGGSLGPAHNKLWEANPLKINEHFYILPSQKSHHLQKFLSETPSKVIDIGEVDENCNSSCCVMGKLTSHTPLGRDRPYVIITLKDFEREAILDVKLPGKYFDGLSCIKDNSLFYLYGVDYDANTKTLESLGNNTKFICYIINRWTYYHSVPPAASQSTSTRHPGTGRSPLKVSSNKPTTSSPQKKDFGYEYIKIKDVIVGTKANIAGVVSVFKPSYRSKGTDYCSTFALVDETSPDSGVNVVSFHKEQNGIPNIQNVGDIVLLRRVMINSYNNLPQALAKSFTSFHVFDGSLNSPITPYCSSYNASLSENDKKLVENLRKWKTSTHSLRSVSKLKDIQANVEFGLVCQIVSVATLLSNKALCLSVCDGTKPPFFTAVQYTSSNNILTEQTLADKYGSYICDVLITDESVSHVSHIKPGKYIYLSDIIASPVHTNTADGKNIVVYNLQTSCNENVVFSYSLLPETDSEVIALKESLAAITDGRHQKYGALLSVVTFTPRISFDFISVGEVLKSEVPYRHHCLVRATGIDAEDIGDIVQLRCSNCSTSYSLPTSEDSSNEAGRIQAGSPCLTCKQKIPSDVAEVIDTPVLKYVYAFMLHVEDSTGSLSVLVCEEEGHTFMGSPPPSNFYIDKQAGDLALKRLKTLFGRNPFLPATSEEVDVPLIDCCIYSYHVNSVIVYRLFDTYLAHS